MKRLASLVLIALLAVPALSGAAAVPTVHLRDAEEFGGRALRNDYVGWRKRDSGYLDCRGGKVDRTHWACKFGWIRGQDCAIGKLQVYGEDFENGKPFYGVHIKGRRC